MPGMTDQQQRDMEAQLRAEIRFARRERDALRARLENAEAALRESLHILAVEDKGDHYCPIVGCGTPVWGEHVPACPFAALGAAGEKENVNG